MRRSRWVFGLCVLGVSGTFAQQSPAIYGPIEDRNLRVLQLPFFRFTLHGASLAEHSSEWNIHYNESNDMRVLRDSEGRERLREDQETTRFTFTYRQGLGHGLELGVEVPLEYRGGGFMDKMITWWHMQVLNTAHPDRDAAPINRLIVRYPGGDFEGSAFGLGDVSATLGARLARQWRVQGAVKLPTGDEGRLLGSGSPDAGLSLDYIGHINSRWTLYVLGSVIAQGKSTLVGARGFAHQEAFSFVYHPNSRDAWVGQWNSESAAIQTGLPASDATHRQLTFGYERRIAHDTRLDLYFMEDRDFLAGTVPEIANVAPDFGVGVMLKRRF